MNILRCSLLYILIITAKSYVLHNHIDRKFALRTFESYDTIINAVEIKNKIKSFAKLARYNNILPVMLLNFTGGWLANPSFLALIASKSFFASIAITVFVTMYSMIMNDLFDINLDRINNPTRPLVSGAITKTEAVLVSLYMFGMSEVLNIRYIPYMNRIIVRLAFLVATVYTPILKRIVFIKNITCAGLISFSIFFTANVINAPFPYKHNILFNIAMQFIFWGSLHSEILLDICDKEGDERNGVVTLPVRYGRDVAFGAANFILHYNVIWNLFYSMSRAYGYQHGVILILFCSPLLKGLYNIKNDYNVNEIKHVAYSTSKPMFLVLMYLCYMRSATK